MEHSKMLKTLLLKFDKYFFPMKIPIFEKGVIFKKVFFLQNIFKNIFFSQT